MSPEQAQQEIAATLPRLVAGGDESRQARERIVAIMAAQLGITPEEANQRLDRLQGQAKQTKDQAIGTAKQAAESTAKGASRTSFIAFIALLLGAVAAGIGGHVAARRGEHEAAA